MGGTAAAAMSKFTRALKEYESVEESIDALLGATPQNDDEAIKLLERARKTVADMEGLTESMAKFEATAKETDPDKQLYGEKMVQKVFALVESWNLCRGASRNWVKQDSCSKIVLLNCCLGSSI